MNKQNDHDFFDENILPYQKNVTSLIIRLSGDLDLANEITQDTMCDAFRYIKKVRASDNVKAYLLTIAKNKFRKYHKKYKHWIPLDEIEDTICSDEEVENSITEAETTEELSRMLDLLDEKYSHVLILHYYEDMPLVEIARVYGVSPNTVYSWHARALIKLKEIARKLEISDSI